MISRAVQEYCADVREGSFPSDAESYHAGAGNSAAAPRKPVSVNC
jgi:hypothetical protein